MIDNVVQDATLLEAKCDVKLLILNLFAENLLPQFVREGIHHAFRFHFRILYLFKFIIFVYFIFYHL